MRETCTILFAPDKELLQVSLPVEILGVLWAGPWQLRYMITVEPSWGTGRFYKKRQNVVFILCYHMRQILPFLFRDPRVLCQVLYTIFARSLFYASNNILSRQGFACEEPAISLHSHHVLLVQWSARLLPVMRDPGSIPRGDLMWNRDSPVSIVSLHWWPQCDWSLWSHLRWASSRTVH